MMFCLCLHLPSWLLCVSCCRGASLAAQHVVPGPRTAPDARHARHVAHAARLPDAAPDAAGGADDALGDVRAARPDADAAQQTTAHTEHLQVSDGRGCSGEMDPGGWIFTAVNWSWHLILISEVFIFLHLAGELSKTSGVAISWNNSLMFAFGIKNTSPFESVGYICKMFIMKRFPFLKLSWHPAGSLPRSRRTKEPLGPPVTVFIGNITERAPDGMVRLILNSCGTVHNWKRVQGASGKLQGRCPAYGTLSTLERLSLFGEVGLVNVV